MVFGLRLQKPIIGSFPVEVISDNAPLIFLMKSSTSNSRVARWQAATLDFDIINFKHLPGKQNIPADCMSRKPHDLVDDILDDLPIMAAITARDAESEPIIIDWDVEELKWEQDRDPLYKEIKTFLKGKRAELPRFLPVPINQFEIQSGILYFKDVSKYGKERYQCCLTKKYQRKALILSHSSPLGGHSGEQHTFYRLRKYAFWPAMRKDSMNFVKNCELCKKYKRVKVSPVPCLRSPQVTRPWQCVHTDIVGPLPLSLRGNKYIVTFIDVLTRFGIAVAIPNKNTETVARAMFENVFSVYGVIENLVSDNGGEYTSKLLEDALSYMKVKHRRTTSYRPAANGISEAWNKQLMSILKSTVQDDEQYWDQYLHLAVFSYNVGYNRTIRESPFFLLFGRDPVLPYYNIFQAPTPWYNIDSYKHELASVMNRIFRRAQLFIEQGQLQQEVYKNLKAKKKEVHIGDRIYILKKTGSGKLKGSFVGPFRVVDIKGVIIWAKSILNGEQMRVHADRVRVEEELSTSECRNVRSCFPNKLSEREWTEVEASSFGELESDAISELEKTRKDVEEREETREESIINREIPITYVPGGYQTRSKGTVHDEDWVMKKPL